MKLGLNLIFMTISGLTLLSGCTKKNVKSQRGVKPAAQRKVNDHETKKMDTLLSTPRAGDVTAARDQGASKSTPTEAITPPAIDSAPLTSQVAPNSGASTVIKTPVTAKTLPLPNTPATNDPLVKYEECIRSETRKLLVEENESETGLGAMGLFLVKNEANRVCEKPVAVGDKADVILVKLISDLAAEISPGSKNAVTYFKDMEALNLLDNERAALYEEYDSKILDLEKQESTKNIVSDKNTKSENSVISASAQPVYQNQAAQPAAQVSAASAVDVSPVEVKDMARFENCLNAKIDDVINSLKKGKNGRPPVTVINHPGQIAQLRYGLPQLCKFQDQNTESVAKVEKIIREKLIANFPPEKAIQAIEAFTMIDGKNLNGPTKAIVIEYFNLDVELESKNIVMSGGIDSNLTKGNVVAYALNKVSGDLGVTYRNDGKEPISKAGSIRNSPFINAIFSFDFHGKKGVAGTLTVTVNQQVMEYDFTIIQGDLKKISSSQSVVVRLTSEAWQKVLSTQTRISLGLYSADGIKVPLSMHMENMKDNVNRTCELSALELKCVDVDAKVKFKIDLDTVHAIKN